MTAVNRQSLVSRKKSRIYLYCGEAITHAAQAIERKVTGAVERAERLALLAIFGELAFPRLDVEAIIGSEAMHESRMLRRIRNEEAVQGQRAAILRVLRARFGAEAAGPFSTPLEQIDELDRLEALLDLAAICQTADVFRAGLPQT